MLHDRLILAAFPINRTQTDRRTSRYIVFHAKVRPRDSRPCPLEEDTRFFTYS
jgi:hypothetical protein